MCKPTKAYHTESFYMSYADRPKVLATEDKRGKWEGTSKWREGTSEWRLSRALFSGSRLTSSLYDAHTQKKMDMTMSITLC